MSAEDGKHIGTSDHHYHPHPLPHNGMSQGDADSQQPVMGFPPPLSPNNNASAPPDPYLPAHPAPVYPPQHPTVYPPGQPAPYPPTVINEINIGNPGVGYVYAEGRPVLVQAKPGLPCCGMGVGWFLFIIGWFLCAIPWYAGAMVLLCSKIDPREKSGLTACTIMAIIITIAATIMGIKK